MEFECKYIEVGNNHLFSYLWLYYTQPRIFKEKKVMISRLKQLCLSSLNLNSRNSFITVPKQQKTYEGQKCSLLCWTPKKIKFKFNPKRTGVFLGQSWTGGPNRPPSLVSQPWGIWGTGDKHDYCDNFSEDYFEVYNISVGLIFWHFKQKRIVVSKIVKFWATWYSKVLYFMTMTDPKKRRSA